MDCSFVFVPPDDYSSSKKTKEEKRQKRYRELRYPDGKITHVSLTDENGNMRHPHEIYKDMYREKLEFDMARGTHPRILYPPKKHPITYFFKILIYKYRLEAETMDRYHDDWLYN